MDAPEQLLLGEGVCRQLNIITYHPSVFGKGGRKGDEEHWMKKTTRADGTRIHTEFVPGVSCAGAVNKRADTGMEKPSKGRPVAVTAGLVQLCETLHYIHRSIYIGTKERTDKDIGKSLLC